MTTGAPVALSEDERRLVLALREIDVGQLIEELAPRPTGLRD